MHPPEGVRGALQGRVGLGLHWGEVDPQKENGGLLLEEGGRGKLPATPPTLLWPGVPEPPTYEQLLRPPNTLALAWSARRPF